jgi:hypothetical protein
MQIQPGHRFRRSQQHRQLQLCVPLVSTRGARCKERNDRINDAVGDLIASGTAWVYAVNAYEESMFNTVILNLGEDETRDAISSGRAAVHSAQLRTAALKRG